MIVNDEWVDLGYMYERDPDSWVEQWVNWSIEEATKRVSQK